MKKTVSVLTAGAVFMLALTGLCGCTIGVPREGKGEAPPVVVTRIAASEGENEADDQKVIPFTLPVLREYLGAARYLRDLPEKQPMVGVVNGLAYTAVGGEMLSVECSVLKGSGALELTGKLGDVMKESAQAARSWVRVHAASFGLADDFYKTNDIHIHVPEGAVPKDGPSAGVTITTAMVSALTGRAVRQDIAMTGEITLRGRVLPIGGVKEKMLAAYRAGIRTLILPRENEKDLEDVPPYVIDTFRMVYAEENECVYLSQTDAPTDSLALIIRENAYH